MTKGLTTHSPSLLNLCQQRKKWKKFYWQHYKENNLISKILMTTAIFLGSHTPQEPRPINEYTKVPKSAKCPQFWETAQKVGWKRKDLKTLDMIMFRESRCIPSAFNAKDPMGGSRGLVQINGFWTPWLHKQGVLSPPKASQGLFNPAINLLAALHIYNYGVDRYGEGWGPWRSSDVITKSTQLPTITLSDGSSLTFTSLPK